MSNRYRTNPGPILMMKPLIIEDTNPNHVLLDDDSDSVNEKDGGEEVKQNNKMKYFDIVYFKKEASRERNLSAWKHDESKLPFKFVDNEAFIEYTSALTGKKCMKECGVESKRFLCGDCSTRWNSTQDLLKIVVALEEVFIKHAVQDISFGRDLGRVLKHSDFKINIFGNGKHNNEDVGRDVGNDFVGEFLNVEGNNPVAMENELNRYLNEPKAPYTNGFDILHWWKQNALRFPIVSWMAKEIEEALQDYSGKGKGKGRCL
ncbi:hypothetical protein OSB04_017260 [Centaurea solstitialis]|uniref:HAT C-terminal dimerisation domain-containing protein n=1 Tax=Centaurea solstitialis TaxID=347529 RepID=A0AA38T2J7_9ASTR|nr:hypothetical protein OSB04_017260 [Centaurea solstitialis]